MKNILISGARLPACLHLARQFGRKKYNVFVADCNSLSVTRFSKYVKFRKFTSPQKDEKKFIEDIKKICEIENIDVLIPAYEEGLYFSKYEDYFKKTLPKLKIIITKYDILSKIGKKFELEKLLKDKGINFVKSHKISNKKDLEKYVKKDKKYVLKPNVSRFGSSLKLIKYEDLKSLEVNFKQKFILQDYIEGVQYSSYSYINKGEVLTIGIYPKEFSAESFGASINFKNERNELIEKFVKTISKKLNYSGQLGLDIIISKENALYIIDANPRLTSGIHLYSDKDNIIDTFLFNKKCNPTNRDSAILLGLFSYGIKNLFNPKLRKKYINTIKSSKDIIFSKDDVFPIVGQIIYYFVLVLKSLVKRKKIKDLLLEDLNYDF